MIAGKTSETNKVGCIGNKELRQRHLKHLNSGSGNCPSNLLYNVPLVLWNPALAIRTLHPAHPIPSTSVLGPLPFNIFLHFLETKQEMFLSKCTGECTFIPPEMKVSPVLVKISWKIEIELFSCAISLEN